MTELAFQYPDIETRLRCEASVTVIRRAARTMLVGIVTIGRELIGVKTILGHSNFASWLAANFDWSYATADNYMTASRAVEEYPHQAPLCSLQVLYLLTKQLPQEIKDEIMGTLTTLTEARLIISKHRAEEWKRVIERTIQIEPGEALFEIERALEHEPGLREVAAELMRTNAEKFALLSDREPQEMLMEAGLTLEEQYPGNSKVKASLGQGATNQHISVLIKGNPFIVATFPKVENHIAAAAQNAAIRAVCKELKIGTVYRT